MQANKTKTKHHHHASNTIYVLGFIGAAVYHLQLAVGFWASVIAVVKALLWPAFLVYELFKFLEV